MPEKKFTRYAMFGSLYFSQGTILSYFTALNALYFLDRGLTMSDVGIFASIALIPFVIKIFLGMLSDRVNLFGMGHRKPYILIGLAVQVICLIIVPFIDPAKYYWGFVGLAFILQMGMALYDTCTDGLALDTTPEAEQSTIQGVMVGGRALGTVLTASIVGLLAQFVSWAAVFWLLAALTLVPIPFVLRIKEGARPVERTFDWSAFAAFKRKQVIGLAAIGFIFFLIIAGVNQNVNPFLEQEFGIALSQAGFITTVWGIGVVLGGVTGGTLLKKIGKLNGTLLAVGISVLAVIGLSLIQGKGMAWPIVFLFGLSYGTYQTVYYALAMKASDSRIAASMFSILMAITNIAQGVGMAIAGGLADAIDFRPTFVIFALVNFIVLLLLPLVFGKRETGAAGEAAA